MYLYSNYNIFSAKNMYKTKCKTVSTNINLENENKIKNTKEENRFKVVRHQRMQFKKKDCITIFLPLSANL